MFWAHHPIYVLLYIEALRRAVCFPINVYSVGIIIYVAIIFKLCMLLHNVSHYNFVHCVALHYDWNMQMSLINEEHNREV